MSRKKTEQAMVELLANSECASVAERPSKLILPDELHSKILDTVQESQDGYERSIGLSYLHGKWAAGQQLVGETDHIKTRHPHHLRPHIRMHTHPKPDTQLETLLTERYAVERGWGQAQTADMVNRNRLAYEGYFMLPSAADVELIYPRSTGTIGNMIASGGGIFFSVLGDVNSKESFGSDYWSARGEAADKYDAKISDAVNMRLCTEGTRAFVLDAAAKVLAHKYTCYFGEDPENPTLTKVEPQ